MKSSDQLWIIGYREWSILALGGLFPAIGVVILSESSSVTSILTGVLVIGGGSIMVWLGIRKNVAIAIGSGVRMICPFSGDRWVPRDEIRSVRLFPGGVSLLSGCTVTLVTRHGSDILRSESITWKGGIRRGTLLAEMLNVPLEIERGSL